MAALDYLTGQPATSASHSCNSTKIVFADCRRSRRRDQHAHSEMGMYEIKFGCFRRIHIIASMTSSIDCLFFDTVVTRMSNPR
jgi:hypothetical protein